jgi:hypothetical protein
MELLELYDLDKLIPNRQLPPPLPPPRQHRQHLPPAFASERYQFLCDMKRHKTDPVYAATPMFTTIPQSKHVQHQRRLLGSHVPATIIKSVSPAFPNSPEPDSAEPDNATDKEEDSDDDQNPDDDDDDDDHQSEDEESSSSSSSDDNNDDDIFGDDDNKKGIVEQIFNRNKK